MIANAVRSLELAVAHRLRAAMKAFGINPYPEMAGICGATASVVGNWMSGLNLPRVPEMTLLCVRTGLTLDWIYRGTAVSMDPKLVLALSKPIDGKADAAE
ncbi:MAG: hypothetical protein ABSC06_19870 [Rhodopila sp.]